MEIMSVSSVDSRKRRINAEIRIKLDLFISFCAGPLELFISLLQELPYTGFVGFRERIHDANLQSTDNW